MDNIITSNIPSNFDQLSEIHLRKNFYRLLYIKDHKETALVKEGSFDDGIAATVGSRVNPEDRESYLNFWNKETWKKRIEAGDLGTSYEIEYRFQKKDGSWNWIRENAFISDNNLEDPIIMVFARNVQKEYERALAKGPVNNPAHINLPKGKAFFALANRWCMELPSDKRIACIAIDINYFKLYNDIYGWRKGNALLERISSIIEEICINVGFLGGYINGDDFCIFRAYDKDTSDDEIESRVKELFYSIPFEDAFAPAIGVTIEKNLNIIPMQAYDHALIALSEIKGDYFHRYSVYKQSDIEKLRSRQQIMIDMKDALLNKEFFFQLQPKADLHTGRIISSEALVRWKHKDHMISPADFIPVLEETGYVYALDLFTWDEVCKYQRHLIDQNITPLPISVNISRVDFYFADLSVVFKKLLEKYSLDASLIQVEITESAYAKDVQVIRDCCEKLHEMGIKILLDDFGAGYSSLNSLKTMYVDILKADKKLLDQESSEDDKSILSATINMAHTLGLVVVTEGVETLDQVNMLEVMNCNYVQGYYFYKPMSPEEYTKLISKSENVTLLPPVFQRIHRGGLNLSSLTAGKILSEKLLDHIIGPAAIFQLKDEIVIPIQMNPQYRKLMKVEDDITNLKYDMSKDFHPHSYEVFKNAIEQADKAGDNGFTDTLVTHMPNDTLESLRFTIFNVLNQVDAKLYFVTVHKNHEISANHLDERLTFEQIENMLKVLPSNIYLKDAEGKYVFATHYWHHLEQGSDDNWSIRGKTDVDIRKDKDNALKAMEADRKIIQSGVGTSYVIDIHEDGLQEYFEVIKQPIWDSNGKVSGIVGLINDVTEFQNMKKKLEDMATKDALTGLGNRRALREYIKKITVSSNMPYSIISADCNELKRINDTYGHPVGDEYIRMSAMLYQMVLPSKAKAFRLGGDEFIILLPHTSLDKAKEFILTLKEHEKMFMIRNEHISVSYGASVITDPKKSVKACMEEADHEMYVAKRLHHLKKEG